jgi:D-lyxose ketol-isomerase
MLTQREFTSARRRAADMIKEAGILMTEKEENAVDVADFGLSRLEQEGIQILTYFSTSRISAKVLVLFPNQTEPEHWHPPVDADPGKEEIIRALWGDLRFYIPGEDNMREGFIPKGKDDCYTMRHEVILRPGDQLHLPPGTKHWFQAGPQGAVMYSFSTCVRDGFDRFTDSNIVRETKIVPDEAAAEETLS